MILKLLKYDIRGIGKKLLPLYGLSIAFSILSRFTFLNYYYTDLTQYPPFWAELLMGLIFGFTWILIGATFIVTFFVLIISFFKTVYGDEGYLTHTLPITTTQILISKTLNYYLWMFVALIVSLLSILLMFFHFGFFAEFLADFSKIWPEIIAGIKEQITPQIVIMIILSVLTMLIAPISSALMIYLSCGIGAQFRHKLIAGILAYLGISFALSIFNQIIASGFVLDSIVANSYSAYYPSIDDIFKLIVFTFVTTIIQTAGFFLATRYMLDHRLNLE